MNIFGKGETKISVKVSFNNFEKATKTHELGDGSVEKDIRIGGDIDVDIAYRGEGSLSLSTRYVRDWVERIINRLCERDEKIAETNAKKS